MGRAAPSTGKNPGIGSHDELIKFAIKCLHTDKARECAIAISRFAGRPVSDPNPSQIEQLNFSLLQWALDQGRYYDAAAMLWPVTLFNGEPKSTRAVWEMWEESSQFLLQGAASMSKSFSVGVRLLLEWVRDPEYTTIKVLGPSEDHLQNNLFSHLVELHQQAAITLPGVIQSLFIGLNPRARRGSISGVIVPLGKKSAAKLQGTKRFQRRTPHKQFGARSRLFIFMDEVNKIPPGIWSDVDNVLANGDGSPDVFKVGGAFNPQDESDQVGIRAEPEWGWKEFDMDTHFKWKSKRGWDILRLDAMQCENIIEGQEIYSGLQTKEGMERIIKNAGGNESPGYYSMVRAAYPPQGKSFSVIPQGLLHTAKATILWASSPRPCGGADLALEGADVAVLATGQWGSARGYRFPPSIAHPRGEEVLFKLNGQPTFRHMLALEQLYKMPRGDTVKLANGLRDLCKKLGIRPEWLCVDRTGNGAGVHDHMKNYWSERVRGVNYYQSASDKQIFSEDEKTAKEEYVRMVSELWFAKSKFLEFDYLKIDPKVDTESLMPQLGGRLFAPGEKSKVESKKDYCSRGNKSPDEADAVGLLVHAVRMESDLDLVMNAAEGEVGDEGDGGEDFFHIDVTNMCDNSL